MKKETRKQKSRRYSIYDGFFYSIMMGAGESFFQAFGTFLKATNLQLGLLGSLPQAASSIAQLATNRLLFIFKSRKKFTIFFSFLQACMYIPILLVGLAGDLSAAFLIFFATLYWILGAITVPVWNSWMGDLVDEKTRGEYFGKRNRITGFGLFFSFLFAGFLLNRFENEPSGAMIGFIILFCISFISRLMSVYFLTKKYEPKFTQEKKSFFSFFSFLKHARKNNFGIFVLFMSSMTFSVAIASPYFTPYMLNDLGQDFWTYTIIISTALIVKYLLSPVWGSAADRFGAAKVLKLSSAIMPIVPLLWVFSSNPLYLVLAQVYAGFVWAGLEISAFKFIYDMTSPQKRSLCVAYYNVMNGAATLLGGLVGFGLTLIPNLFLPSYLFIFFISFLGRAVTTIFYLPKIVEVKEVQQISNRGLLLKVMKVGPTRGLIFTPVTFFRFRKRKK